MVEPATRFACPFFGHHKISARPILVGTVDEQPPTVFIGSFHKPKKHAGASSFASLIGIQNDAISDGMGVGIVENTVAQPTEIRKVSPIVWQKPPIFQAAIAHRPNRFTLSLVPIEILRER